MWAFINRKRSQIAHAHSIPMGAPCASLDTRGQGGHCQNSFHEWSGIAYFKGSTFFRRMQHWILTQKTARFIAVSTEIAQEL